MIKLGVEDYCEDCEGFTPTTERFKNGVEGVVITVVTCENQRRRAAMYRHILREFEKDKEMNHGTH